MSRVKLAGQRTLDLSRITETPEYDSPLPDLAMDWPAVWTALGLDQDEKAYLEANKLERVPRRRIAAHLKWLPTRVEAVRVRVQRKLRQIRLSTFEDFVIRGNSRRLSYREPAGGWALTELGPGFAEIMAAERADWFGKTRGKNISRAA